MANPREGEMLVPPAADAMVNPRAAVALAGFFCALGNGCTKWLIFVVKADALAQSVPPSSAIASVHIAAPASVRGFVVSGCVFIKALSLIFFIF